MAQMAQSSKEIKVLQSVPWNNSIWYIFFCRSFFALFLVPLRKKVFVPDTFLPLGDHANWHIFCPFQPFSVTRCGIFSVTFSLKEDTRFFLVVGPLKGEVLKSLNQNKITFILSRKLDEKNVKMWTLGLERRGIPEP